ncbi:hypothetical protein ACJIZ3_022218 [Penstemon smallii]|uniref:Uncharacterized protein n=1 Tax=Penstemon smallii TaxID=265156 RepID=A0ABD3SNN1_9LAMI
MYSDKNEPAADRDPLPVGTGDGGGAAGDDEYIRRLLAGVTCKLLCSNAFSLLTLKSRTSSECIQAYLEANHGVNILGEIGHHSRRKDLARKPGRKKWRK